MRLFLSFFKHCDSDELKMVISEMHISVAHQPTKCILWLLHIGAPFGFI